MNRTITTTLMVMAAAATCAYAQAPAPAEEVQVAENKAAVPQQELKLQQDPQLVVGKLHNGLTYMIRPTKEPVGRASVRLHVNTGSLDENDETSGISHFLEHMVFNGSRNFKRGELIPAMQRLGLGFGGDANAYTSLQETVYMLDLPNLNPETVSFAFTIMRDFADGATLEDEAIDHERGIIVSELKSRISESYNAMIAKIEQLTEGTRIAKYMPIGTEQVIKFAPYQLFRDYYKKHYVPERMTLIVTGDFDVATAEKWIRNHFVSMPKAENPEHPALGTISNTGRSVRLLPVSEQATVNMSASTVKQLVREDDSLEKRIKDMPLQVACAILNSRMSRIAQQADSPFISAGVGSEELFDTADIFSLSVTASPEKWNAALQRAEQELRKAIQYGFEEHEFTEILSGAAAELAHSIETWETVSASAMASHLVDAVGNRAVHTDPVEDMRIFQLGVQMIAQNPDCCRAALEQAYNAAASKLTATGTIPADMTEESLEAAFEEANKVAVERPVLRAAKPFAYDNIGEPGKIVKKDHIADLDVTTLTLSNGVKVNLKRTDFRKGAITVSAAIDGGSLKMPQIPGLNMVAGSVIALSALEAHDLDELKRIMLGHNVDLNFSLEDTRMSYSGGTTEEDLELQCKLIVAGIMHPAYREEAIAMIHRRLPGMYQQLTNTPEGAFALNSARALYGDDVRFNVPAQQQVEAITTEQVKAAMQPYFENGAIEVTLVGDFDIEKALPIIERTFGAMPARNPEFTELTPEQSAVNFRPWGQEEFFRYPSNLDKTLVVQVRHAGNGKDVKRMRRLRVLASIARAKLFDGIRAKMGETYSPSVSVSSAPDMDNGATISTTSAGVKRNRKLVNDAMTEILAAVGRGEFTQDDFDCAIRPIIASAEKSLRQNGFWCSALEDLQSDPEKLENVRNMVADLKSITFEEIQQLAKEVFGSDKVNCYFTVPDDYTPADEEQGAEAAPAPAAEAPPIAKVAPTVEDYTVIITESTAKDEKWDAVADALVKKYPGAKKVVIPALTEKDLTEALRKTDARYAAIVVKPEEVGRDTINHMHRAARKVDDDIWGDCIWGIVTGYNAKHAMRIAKADEPLVIKRLLGTTNVGWHHFENSYCITDWTNSPVLAQNGGVEPTTTTYDNTTEKGQTLLANGFQSLFAEQMEEAKPQMVVTSSHATQFNLEMPFSRGLIFPYGNRFYQLKKNQMGYFFRPLTAAREGNPALLGQLAEKLKTPSIKPDGTTRIWLAAGNCLFGDACHTKHSMAVTALSAYTCNQVVGYTVPSWYGAGGWGTLSCFFDAANGTPLSHAWFLNNQFILNNTMNLDPKLLQVQFNGEQVDQRLQMDVIRSGARLNQQNIKDALGYVHDRDVVAFYGDPAWSASLDCGPCPCPYVIVWQNDKQFTITANMDRKGRLGVWFPTAATGQDAKECNVEGAVLTDDFILFPEIELKKGESKTVIIK